METLWWAFSQLLWALLGALWWLAYQLLWVTLWLLLPLIVVALVALKVAERMLGAARVRAWLKAQSLRLGSGAARRLRVVAFALTALPFRVLFWLVLYTLWHSIISLAWRPHWRPWQRAWARRWRRRAA